MSGPAIHHLVGEKVPQALNDLSSTYSAAASSMQSNEAHTNFGTVGPDFLFFHTKDLDPSLDKVVSLYLDVADFIREFKEKIRDLVPDELIALKEELEDFVGSVADRSVLIGEIEDGVSDFRDVISVLKATLENAVVAHVTDSFNVFKVLEHPIQDGTAYDKWWWFDTLHYRQTGQFAEKLLEKTSPGTPEHAYALGYLSHVASDVVGHPYVNLIAGGPFRTQSQRHKLAENFHDTWSFQNAGLPEFVDSGLHSKFDFGISGGQLPGSISKLFAKTLKEVYGTNFGTLMSEDDVNKAYRLWYTWFKNTTDSGSLPVPQPYSIDQEMMDAWEQFTDNLGDIGDYVGDSFSGGGGILGLLAALAAAILGPVLLALAIIDFIAGAVATIAMAPFRFFLNVAYELLYDSYSKYRYAVALNGLAFPLNSYLNIPLLSHLNDPRVQDDQGNRANMMNNSYPRQEFNGLGNLSHLIYPQSAVEQIITNAAPKVYYNDDTKRYYEGPVSLDASTIEWIYSQLDETNLNSLHSDMAGEKFGTAASFTAHLYHRFKTGKHIPDFNLDADRGMGYRTWKPLSTTPPATNQSPVDIQFV